MADTFNVRIKHKRDTSANWTSKNPVLLNGEIVIVDTDAGGVRYKVGDGVKTYTQLPFDDEALRSLVNSKADAVDVPTKTSDLTNDSGFITTADIPEGAAASTTAPKMDGTAAVGTELAFARGDHVHPSDTSRVPVTRTVNGKALSSNITLSASDVNADAYGAASSALSSAKSYTDSQVAELKNGTVSYATNADEANHATSADIAGEADHAVLADNATNAEHATSADSATTAGSATKATQDGNGKVIATTYETKSDASAKLVEAKGYTDQVVGELSEGFDGVIRQMYADDITEDGAPTIREIAADEAGDALADAKSYADSKVAAIDYPVDSVNGKTGTVTLTYTDVGAAASSHGTHVTYSTTAPVMDGTASAGSAATVARSDHKHPTDTSRVPTSRTVNGKALSANITLSASDVGADASGAAATALANAKTYADGKIEELTGGDVSVGHATSADSATKAAQDASGNVITTTYETKSDASAKLAEAKAYADDIKDDLLNGAGAAYDTLKELGDLIDTNADAIDALETVASGKANASHTHGNITNAGAIGTAANKAVITTTNGVLTTGTVPVASGGTGATTAAGALTNLGITATAAELNIMDGVTATAAEINKLDGLTAKTAELNYVSGVTSNIQTQLNNKSNADHVHTNYINQHAFSTITVGTTDIDADQTRDQLTLVAGANVTITPDTANDSITIAATDTKYTHPSYTAKGSGLYKVTVDATGHVSAATAVAKSDITGLGIPAQDTTYSAATTSAAGLMSAADKTKLDGIATGANKITVDTALSSTSTNPVQNKVINTALAGKAASSHNHSAANITSGTLAVARGGTGVTANPSMLTNLGSTTAASVFAASPRPGVTGTLPIANGGTGATTPAAAKEALEINAEWINEAHNHQGKSINPASIELVGADAHGGYIDFHFGGVTDDYTSRIIEDTSGQISVSGTLKVKSPGPTTNAVRNIFANTITPTIASAEGTIRLVYE